MSEKKSFEERYQDNDTPWELNRPDHNLIDFFTSFPIPAMGTAIDIGCGTGNNSIWLASHGFQVTGCDLSDIAIDQAQKKAAAANVRCTFFHGDIMKALPPGAPFAFAFDRGCFHTFEGPADRSRIAARVAELLGDGGRWLSLVGSKDEDRGDRPGPPQLSVAEVMAAVEPFFELISMRRGHFDANHAPGALNWICHFRKRVLSSHKSPVTA